MWSRSLSFPISYLSTIKLQPIESLDLEAIHQAPPAVGSWLEGDGRKRNLMPRREIPKKQMEDKCFCFVESPALE